jgi:hypothetical protein
MANWHRMQFFMSGDDLHLYFEDSLTGQYDTTLKYHDGQWYIQEYNDSELEDEWFTDTPIDSLEARLIQLLTDLAARDTEG